MEDAIGITSSRYSLSDISDLASAYNSFYRLTDSGGSKTPKLSGMTSEVEYVQNLNRNLNLLRSNVRQFDTSTGRGQALIFGTFIPILFSAFYCLISSFKKEQKRTRLIATSPRTAFDYIGKFTSDVLAFVIFPLFVVFYVVVSQWIIAGGKVYEGKVLTVGYLLHSSSGSLYFIAGGLQFYSPLRQRYPRLHRFLGYMYYFMAMLTSIGLALLALKPHSGFSTQIAVLSFLPPWILCNISAFRAIVIYRDVELHR
jgi:Predicted membrane protein (DUF2306)